MMRCCGLIHFELKNLFCSVIYTGTFLFYEYCLLLFFAFIYILIKRFRKKRNEDAPI